VIINLPVVQPFPYEILLTYLAKRLIPEKEIIENRVYTRHYTSNSRVSVSYDKSQQHLVISIKGKLKEQDILPRVKHLFQPDHNSQLPAKLLSDPIIGKYLKKTKGIRPLGCWDPFELVIRTVVGQQVSVAAASTITARISQRCNGIIPKHIATTELDQIGMPKRRVDTIQTLARQVYQGDIDLSQPWNEISKKLLAVKGIGPWTVAYLGIRLGRDPDAFPNSDLGLVNISGARNPSELLTIADAWKPHRALAATYLWMSEYL
jgi:3-methyladenine DNA glycosylase/8-oxoguanine DNA glycosylase